MGLGVPSVLPIPLCAGFQGQDSVFQVSWYDTALQLQICVCFLEAPLPRLLWSGGSGVATTSS